MTADLNNECPGCKKYGTSGDLCIDCWEKERSDSLLQEARDIIEENENGDDE